MFDFFKDPFFPRAHAALIAIATVFGVMVLLTMVALVAGQFALAGLFFFGVFLSLLALWVLFLVASRT